MGIDIRVVGGSINGKIWIDVIANYVPSYNLLLWKHSIIILSY